MKQSIQLTAAFLICICWCSSNSAAQDSPALRGARGDGIGVTAKSIGRSSKLSVAWKKKIGSGYSSVSVADGKAFTMYSSGEEDKLGCFDTKTGNTRWEFSLDKRFKGENGSFDGPISTPLIHEGLVYGLSCQGRFACVNAESGDLVWEKKLTEAFEVRQPLYGFSTSPIIAGGNVILQVGAKDNMLVAMNPKTGEVVWGCGNDSINSQIPSLINIDGVPIILASGGKQLTGVNPENGEIVFEFEHGGGNGSAVMPVSIGDNNVLITVDDAFSKAVNLRPIDENKIAASEKWQHRSIKNTYNIPTLCNGNLFAFSTRILTCVDPETGRPRWKSRKPGDGFLMAVNDFIAIITKEGSIHLASATDEKYDEIASLKVFDDLVWTVPAFAEDAIFVRSLGEIARIDIVSENEAAESGEADRTLPVGNDFATLLKDVNGKEPAEANQIVSEFLTKQDTFPIVDSGIAHFVYRGPEDDVALASDILGARQEQKMLPVGQSDMKYYSIRLENDQRANYVFLVNFKPQTDSLNPRTATSSMYAGEMEFAVRLRNEEPLKMSWFAMDGWSEPEYLTSLPEKLHGKLVERSLDLNEKKGDDAAPEEETPEQPPLELSIYLPPNYEGNEDRFPVIYVLPHMRFELSQFVESADNLYSKQSPGIRPSIIVVPKGRTPPGATPKIVSLIDESFRSIPDRDSRSVVGFGFSGGTALGALLGNQDMFGAASVQSPLVFGTDGLVPGLKALAKPTRVYLDWGRFDMHNPVENWDLRKTSGEIFQVLEANEFITATGGMVNDSADWASWKNRYDKVLQALSPPPKKQPDDKTSEPTEQTSVKKLSTDEDRQLMKKLLGITKMRPGKSPKADSENSANIDESKANPYSVLPHLMMIADGREVTNPDLWWKHRRPEIVRAFEYEIYGRVPANVPSVTWVLTKTTEKKVGDTEVTETEYVGKVDNSACPEIDVNISMVVGTPAHADSKSPMLMMFGFTGFEPWVKKSQQENPAHKMLVERGWGYATISPYKIQGDRGADLTRGIIGLCNAGKPRDQKDWGALRAWAWGASQAFDHLQTLPNIDSNRIGIEGVSRFGKAALVTMAFDERFACALIGSSGKGGATLLRRNFGEGIENLTGEGGYHWMAGGFLKYGAEEAKFGRADANNLPVDSHQLIALCAPRPTFISYGIPEKGDAHWLDQRGSFMAAIAAQPAFRLLGARDLGRTDEYLTEEMPPVNEGLMEGHLAWRQHDGGHTDLPNLPHFVEWADNLLAQSTDRP